MHIYKLANILIPNNKFRYEEYDKVFEELINILQLDKEDKVIILNGNYHNKINSSNSIKKSYEIKKKILELGYPIIVIDGKYDNVNESKITLNDNELNNNKIIYIRDNQSYEKDGIIFFKGKIEKEEKKKIYRIERRKNTFNLSRQRR